VALRAVERVEELSHPATRRLHAVLDELAAMTAAALGGVDGASSEADLVDQIALLERLRGAVAAVHDGRRRRGPDRRAG
jgi:hypothetical protein